MANARHLVGRYFESVRPGAPPAADDAWAVAFLGTGEAELWRSMPGFDRRHAIGVARRALAACPVAGRAAVAAALLHDVGKVASGLGVHGRVVATLVKAVRGARRTVDAGGRLGRYVDHPAIGAQMLTDAGADPLTIAWTREHHQPEADWTVPVEVGRVLKDADDD